MKRSHLISGLFASLCVLPLLLDAARSTRRVVRKRNQLTVPQEQDIFAQLAQPITLTPDGIKNFLRHTYNHHDYALEFLPNNFSHLLQFLRKGQETHQKRAYVQSVFRLFTNKLKAGSYVNAYAFSDMLEELPKLIEEYFVVLKSGKSNEHMHEHINEMLYSRFLSQFKSFKNNPVEFLDSLSHDIVTTIEEQHEANPTDPIGVEELRKTILMFLEVGLSKLIWNPEDQDDTWRSVKNIADDLSALFEHNIIVDQDDLNDLFRSLIERYCFFIDVTGSDFTPEFFDRVKQDIETNPLLLFNLEEEEEVESKKQRLTRSLSQAQQKALKSDRKRARA